MSKWLPLAESLLSMVVQHIPNPISAQVTLPSRANH